MSSLSAIHVLGFKCNIFYYSTCWHLHNYFPNNQDTAQQKKNHTLLVIPFVWSLLGHSSTGSCHVLVYLRISSNAFTGRCKLSPSEILGVQTRIWSWQVHYKRQKVGQIACYTTWCRVSWVHYASILCQTAEMMTKINLVKA